MSGWQGELAEGSCPARKPHGTELQGRWVAWPHRALVGVDGVVVPVAVIPASHSRKHSVCQRGF